MSDAGFDVQKRPFSEVQPQRHQKQRRLQYTGQPRMNTRSRGMHLCKRCQRINLDAIFSKKHLTKGGNPVRELGPVAHWSIESCPLCELMFKAFGPMDEDKRTTNKLRSLASSRIVHRGWKAINTVMLTIDGYKEANLPFLVPQPHGVNTVRILKPLMSFDPVTTWLNFCRKNHNRICGSLSGSASVSSISSFKLVDCTMRRIVKGSGQPYIALSYVWGSDSSSTPHPFSDMLPDDVPNTIRDAITVTQALGFRYIWIDRYCINQEDKEEVAEQVPKMDLIYSNSELAIIAAAGEDPHHGLPGIRPRSLWQPHGKIGKQFLVSTMKDPVPIILDSKWMTRGWTYQEGVLSRRRLVFTNQQVYFECSGMYCCEALDLPLSRLHTQDQKRFKSDFADGVNMGIFPRKLGYTAWEVVERIEEYSKRSLTNPLDILDGFRGILRALEKGPQKIRHLFGVPVIPRPPSATGTRRWNTPEAQESYDAYEWSPFVGFCIGLCWDAREPLERREGFPSWSWTGWLGGIKWGFEEWQWREIHGNGDLRVQVQLKDKRIIAWKEFNKSYDDLSLQASSILRVSAWVTPLQLLGFSNDTVKAVVKDEEGRLLRWRFRPTATGTKIPSGEYMAIHLAQGIRGQAGLFVMAVCEAKPGIYQRVGFGEMTINNLSDPNERNWRGFLLDQTPPKVMKLWREFNLC
jgi:hypothetical protein